MALLTCALSLAALAAPPTPELITAAAQARWESALCPTSEQQLNSLQTSLTKLARKGDRQARIAQAMRDDVAAAAAKCSSPVLQVADTAVERVVLSDTSFPSSIFGLLQTPAVLFQADAEALAYLQSKEGGACPEITSQEMYQNSRWHSVLLESGWSCVARNFVRLTQELNAEKGYAHAQARLSELNALSLAQLKTLFKQKFRGKGYKFAFVPQLSWENGALNTAFPYSLFTSSTELTSYRRLVRDFRKLGFPATLIERNSMNPLSEQVRETSDRIARLNGKHIVISRSMGARVMREILVENRPEVVAKMSAMFNVGGTPHGSVIADAKARPDVFYFDVVPTVLGALKLPVSFIAAIDPRIPNHIKSTLLAALDRQGLLTMAPIQAGAVESAVPVVNALFVRTDYQRATEKVDPTWAQMVQYGPTEGSSLLAGASIDTVDSLRLIVESDHLAFWKYSPREALAVYLRQLIVAEELGVLKQ